ncbi:MAG: pirin family protein [Polyangiaceae bacterium]
MITVRPSERRGHANHGWLDSRFTFSFAEYYDPKHMGFRQLRVINDDHIAPGQGFGTHPHADMEIVTYVLDGAVAHKDSMGNGSTIRPGEVQRMSAGTGVRHSEFNASKEEMLHLLQIWMLPSKRGIQPSYEQKTFGPEEKQGRLRVVASPDGRDGSVTIHTDVVLYAGLFAEGESAELLLAKGRHAWVHVAKGMLRVNGRDLGAGDGMALSEEEAVKIEGTSQAEVLVFDLA